MQNFARSKFKIQVTLSDTTFSKYYGPSSWPKEISRPGYAEQQAARLLSRPYTIQDGIASSIDRPNRLMVYNLGLEHPFSNPR